MQHQKRVKEFGIFVCVALVVAEHTQEVLRHGEALLGVMDVEALFVEVVALHGVGVGDYDGEARNQLYRLAEHVLKTGVVGVGVVGVEGEDAAGELVHHVAAGGLDNHVLGEVVRQGAGFRQYGVELLELLFCGQLAHEQQVGDLLVAEAAVLDMRPDYVDDVYAAVVQPAGDGDNLAVLDVVAYDAAYAGDAGHDAGAVAVAESAFYLIRVVFLGYAVSRDDAVVQLRAEIL